MNLKAENGKLFLVLYLGILSAFAPFVMDTYLASLPELAAFFSATASEAQLSLASCVAGLAIGQLFLGSISDGIGRRTPLLVSLAIYVIVTAGCILSPDIKWFISLRFVQGLAAAGGVVLTRSIVADCYQGAELTRMYGVVGTINGVATVMAPLVGGLLAMMWGWKGVFWALLSIGAAMLPFTAAFRETLPPSRCERVSPSALASNMGSLLATRRYLVPCIGFAMFMSLIIVNLSSAPFVFNDLGLTEGRISLLLGINSVVLGITALLSSRFDNQQLVMRISAIVIAVGTIVIVSAIWRGVTVWHYEAGLIIVYAGLGGLNTSSVALAMDAGREHAGAASALLGSFGYLVGGIVTAIEGSADLYATTPILLIILSAATFLLTQIKTTAISRIFSHTEHTSQQ